MTDTGDDRDDDRDDDRGRGGTVRSCDACPVGFLAEVFRDAQPEATVHLLAATRELLLAFETVVRAAEERLERQAGEATDVKQPRVRRIDIA